ncbi:family 78 glycoside hydrolase catalytic domain [Pseudarthrobacter equi]|uniref:family 78 glycoside hydrolase catalytic domain n=1 Tax=Pseudarthrobacter equi TaxID=728066 RepID=UPI0028D0F0F3|nr:family 78 glycoside hydrolase catalytic domain [Pseudarthrobacter equi]
MTPTWHAEFITSEFSNGALDDPALYFRKEFHVTEGLTKATLKTTAVGLVEPHLNGTRVGDKVLAPGWTSYRNRLAVSSYDVTEVLSEGENAVGAVVGQGWALGRLGWENKSHFYSDSPALFLEIELHYGDRKEYVCSGPGFRVSTGGVRANSIYDGETFDGRLENSGWVLPGFDDSQWGRAKPFEWDLNTLVEPTAPPIRRIEDITPKTITTWGGKTIIDFGQVISGWVRLRSRGGKAGETVTIRHAELVAPDGELDVETLRTAKATDQWILAGPEEEEWEPRFTFHGFRYAEVTGYPGELSAGDITAVVVHSDMARTGWFSSSHELVDRMHENTVWSMRDNFVGVPTDCPQRDERLGWTGDLHAFGPTAVLLHDVRGVLGSWLADLRAEQNEKGFVPWVVPDILSTPSSPTALWSDVVVALPWTLYREYGDTAILEESYDSMAAFVRQVEGLLDENGLWSSGFQYGDWLDPDAPDDNPAGGKTDRHLVASAYFCKTTKEMADTAEILGKEQDAADFRALNSRVRQVFRREYVTAAGRIVNESATAYALAICFGILDEDQLGHAGNQLAQLVAKSGYTISTGFAGTPHVTDALTLTGHLDEAYRLLTQTQCPSFLYPVTQGATTIWERWDSVRPDGTVNPSGMTSLNHYAFGAVTSWLYRVVAGLQPAAPGWRRIRIVPRPGGGLTHASARHETVLGTAEVSWRIESNTMNVDVRIPAGAEAAVVLPLDPSGRTIDVGEGRHHWDYELPGSYGARPDFTMDTPLAELSKDITTWDALTRVFATHLPGIPIDGNGPGSDAMSLTVMLQYVPGASEEFRLDLENALTEAAAHV